VPTKPLIGVLALQGAFAAHQSALHLSGADTRQVRLPADLDGLDGLAMPGGESTTMSRLLLTSGLFDRLSERIDGGLAVFGTCAGMILLAAQVLDGRPDQRSLAAIDISVRRNGYGRQVDSFEADIAVESLAEPFHAVFIRAPKVEAVGDAVTVLAIHDGVPVLAKSGRIFVASFHPELTPDHRLHSLFLQEV
jgi:5'-phosphate synthase pdxT subunit